MRKICVVITARASYSRIKTALSAIKKHPDLNLQLVVTGSVLLEKYGSVVTLIENDGFEITARLYNVLEGNKPEIAVKTTALAMIELSTLFENLKPDAVITIADRFETLATAMAAAYMNIPLIHVQGGEITGSIDDKVRHAVTKLSDIHFVASENARIRVIKMGEYEENVHNTGCPSIDIASQATNNHVFNFNPFKKYGGVGPIFDYRKRYIVVMQHPVTTEYSLSKNQIEHTVRAVEQLGIPAFWFWPNADPGTDELVKGIRSFREQSESCPIHFFKNMESVDFLSLLKNSACLVGNSSVGIRECSFLGIPVVNIGSRQTGRERGNNVIDADHNTETIIQAITYQIMHGAYEPELIYGQGNSGEKMALLLASISLSSHKSITY